MTAETSSGVSWENHHTSFIEARALLRPNYSIGRLCRHPKSAVLLLRRAQSTSHPSAVQGATVGFRRSDIESNLMTSVDRAYGAFLGLAIGDALGVPLEFEYRDEHTEVRAMIGGGPFSLEPGEWTDDTSMALCLADSLIANNGLNQIDLMKRFVRWWRNGENSVKGYCFDIGMATEQALARFEMSGRIEINPDPNRAGNGSLMRLAPVAIFAAPNVSLAAELARRQSECTHGAEVAIDACAFFATLVAEAITGQPNSRILHPRKFEGHPEISCLAAGSWRNKTRDQIRSTGYVVDTLEAALWAVGTSTTFEDALIKAVNLAGDSDTVGAVTGQLAGAIWGEQSVPERWRMGLCRTNHIRSSVFQLVDLRT